MDPIVFKPVQNKDGLWSIQLIVPMKGKKAIELSDIAKGSIPVSISGQVAYYQSPEYCEDDVLLYWTPSNDPEFEEEVVEFIETNVIYEDHHQHMELKSVRRLFTSDEIGMLISTLMTQS